MFSESFRNSVRKEEEEEQLSPEYTGIKHRDVPKYESIKDVLRAAGYFRIRISTLSPFDKVVGGLCWCISNSNVDVDVDVSFEEDPNIGEKIRISENIINSLVLMKCPIKIQPVQIQGLDFDSIYNVLQWLIKKVFETREENKENLRRFTELNFSRNYEVPKEVELRKKYVLAKPFLDEIENFYLPKRKFKPKSKPKRDQQSHVQSVLLEYGKEFKIKKMKKKKELKN